MDKRNRALLAACISAAVVVSIGAKKLSVAYPELAFLIGFYGGMVDVLLLIPVWRAVIARRPAPPN